MQIHKRIQFVNKSCFISSHETELHSSNHRVAKEIVQMYDLEGKHIVQLVVSENMSRVICLNNVFIMCFMQHIDKLHVQAVIMSL